MLCFLGQAAFARGVSRVSRKTVCQYTLRGGTEADVDRIKTLIRAEKMNPIVPNVINFVVAVDPITEDVVGCGQLRDCGGGDNVRELASVIVAKELRGAGIGSSLVNELLNREDVDSKELFLLTTASKTRWYTQFGFEVVSFFDLPTAMLKFEFLLGAIGTQIVVNEGIKAMYRPPKQ